MKGFRMKWCQGILFGLFGVLVLSGIYQYSVLFTNIDNRSDITIINYQGNDIGDYNDSLVFKLIAFDLDKGITTKDIADKAKRNVYFYYEEVSRECDGLGDREYFICANRILGQYFYYTQSTETSNNYAKQQSDCDLNSYLIYDVANNAGIDTSIIYAPNHAFVSWKKDNGLYGYLETTTDNNHGSIANLSTRAYRKNLDKTYYTPFKADDAFTIYQALVFDLSVDKTYITKLSNIKTNALINDTYFDYLASIGHLSLTDVEYIEVLLKTDFTSSDKKLTVADWYLNHGNSRKAKAYLMAIDSKHCNSDCVSLMSDVKTTWRLMYLLYPWYDKLALQLDSHVSAFDYYVLLVLLFTLLFIVISIGGCLYLWRKERVEKPLT